MKPVLPFRILFFLIISTLFACRSFNPPLRFDAAATPAAPDYAQLDVWAAHPQKSDPADRSPCADYPDQQAGAEIDVFFIHPTSLTGDKRNERVWNAALTDEAVNRKTDEGAILYQASIFNGAGRVYAPRYRQAHYKSFFPKDPAAAKQALDTAYADVKAAFEYYLEHWNNGRPFVIAAHSQGARHGMFLIRDLIENRPLQQRLVAAYLVGWPVKEDFFKQLPPCQTPNQTGCFCSWRTWERDFGRDHAFETDVVCTNPLNWTTEEGVYAPKTANKGGVLSTFCAVLPELADAEVYKGVLLCTKPKFPGSVFFRRKNYHVGDLNLYYYNVYQNVQQRVGAFWKG